MLEAQKTARKYKKDYHETLVELEWAQSGIQPAFNQADQVRIQSLEEQLNNANQQLNQLRVEHVPSAAEGQPAVQLCQANEQLEALCAECNILCAEAKKSVAERDNPCKAPLQLRMQSLQNMASSAAKNSALREQCMKAKAEVDQLREENDILKQMSAEQSQWLKERALATQVQDEARATSAALEPCPFLHLVGWRVGW